MQWATKLTIKAYISNVPHGWSPDRQEELLAREVPGWPIDGIYRDILHPRHRKLRLPDKLTERASMLRRTTRNAIIGETIYVATLAALAWTSADFETVLDAAGRRNALITACNTGVLLYPNTPRDEAIEAFRTARNRVQREAAAKTGAQVSAEHRRAATDAKIALIRDRWPLSSKDWPTAALLAECGLARNTVQERLKRRPIAQYLHQRALKRRRIKNDDAALETTDQGRRKTLL